MLLEFGEKVSNKKVKEFFAKNQNKNGMVTLQQIQDYYTRLLAKRGQIDEDGTSVRNSMA